MKILGIDPGIATTGLGFLETDDKGVICSADWLTISTEPTLGLSERLHEIQSDLAEYLHEMKPDLAVVEKIFFATNEQTAITVAHARGVILATVQATHIDILEPTPLQMKSCITGDGSADKRQVQDMMMRVLTLEEPPQPDDAADALALAFYGMLQAKSVLLQS